MDKEYSQGIHITENKYKMVVAATLADILKFSQKFVFLSMLLT